MENTKQLYLNDLSRHFKGEWWGKYTDHQITLNGVNLLPHSTAKETIDLTVDYDPEFNYLFTRLNSKTHEGCTCHPDMMIDWVYGITGNKFPQQFFNEESAYKLLHKLIELKIIHVSTGHVIDHKLQVKPTLKVVYDLGDDNELTIQCDNQYGNHLYPQWSITLQHHCLHLERYYLTVLNLDHLIWHIARIFIDIHNTSRSFIHTPLSLSVHDIINLHVVEHGCYDVKEVIWKERDTRILSTFTDYDKRLLKSKYIEAKLIVNGGLILEDNRCQKYYFGNTTDHHAPQYKVKLQEGLIHLTETLQGRQTRVESYRLFGEYLDGLYNTPHRGLRLTQHSTASFMEPDEGD